jgi:transposase
MSGKAAKIHLSEKMVSVLESIVASDLSAQQLVRRAWIILLGFDGLLNTGIAEKLGIHRKQVGVWRRRWQQSYDALIAIECHESKATFRRAIEQTLRDAPRRGCEKMEQGDLFRFLRAVFFLNRIFGQGLERFSKSRIGLTPPSSSETAVQLARWASIGPLPVGI